MTFQENYFNCVTMRNDYQAYIAVNIQSALISHVSINKDKASEILSLIIESFNIRNSIYEEGLMLCSAIALNIGQEFDVFMEDFLKYLIYALNSLNDVSLCITSVHVTSDLIRGLYNEFDKYVDRLLPPVLNILGDPNADKSFKPHCLNVISDYLINCSVSDNFKYMEQIMILLGNALEAATILDLSDVL
jgi:importin subunit beta-1